MPASKQIIHNLITVIRVVSYKLCRRENNRLTSLSPDLACTAVSILNVAYVMVRTMSRHHWRQQRGDLHPQTYFLGSHSIASNASMYVRPRLDESVFITSALWSADYSCDVHPEAGEHQMRCFQMK